MNVISTAKHNKRSFKKCIKKRFSNNYEKQINSTNEKQVVFTDNKIYISLNGCNSSIKSQLGNSTSSLKKNRRIIYPTSGSKNISGFLRDYDFDYDYKDEAMTNNLEIQEKIKFSLMKNSSEVENTSNDVVFEKVKYESIKKSSACDKTCTKNVFAVIPLKK